MLSDLTQWLGAHSQWLGLAIFLVSLTESLAVAGLVVPGVFLLFAFAALAAGADMPLLEAIAWAFCGAVIGDLLSCPCFAATRNGSTAANAFSAATAGSASSWVASSARSDRSSRW